jgi:hypothetical protein
MMNVRFTVGQLAERFLRDITESGQDFSGAVRALSVALAKCAGKQYALGKLEQARQIEAENSGVTFDQWSPV